MATQATKQDLVLFQERLLKKLDSPDHKVNQEDAWVGFESFGQKYAVQLKYIQEVVAAQSKYMHFGDWIRQDVLGGLQHRSELWVIFNGLEKDQRIDKINADLWEQRLLLVKQSIASGNVGLAVGKVLGSLPFFNEWEAGVVNIDGEEFSIRKDATQVIWKIWEVEKWLSKDAVLNISE
jgi:hypothetical protein